MYFMNEYDIERAAADLNLHEDDLPNLAKAVQTLVRLMDWANSNSDGWAYWPKPVRSANRLMTLIKGSRSWDVDHDGSRIDATPAQLKQALSPVKSFLTRQGVAHSEIGL